MPSGPKDIIKNEWTNSNSRRLKQYDAMLESKLMNRTMIEDELDGRAGTPSTELNPPMNTWYRAAKQAPDNREAGYT